MSRELAHVAQGETRVWGVYEQAISHLSSLCALCASLRLLALQDVLTPIDTDNTADEAIALAEAEVGAAWMVVAPEGHPVSYGDGTGARYHPCRRTVGLDPFGLSRTTMLGNKSVES